MARSLGRKLILLVAGGLVIIVGVSSWIFGTRLIVMNVQIIRTKLDTAVRLGACIVKGLELNQANTENAADDMWYEPFLELNKAL